MNRNDLYFDRTFENVIKRMLANFDKDIDQREGSVAWDIYSPMAVELVLLYIQLSWMWEQMYGDTAQRDALIRLAKDRNIEIMPASQARVEGKFNIKIELSERFNLGDLNFIVVDFLEEKDGYFYYELLAEDLGVKGNVMGDIFPINNITGLKHAEITRVLVPGEDEEDTEAFRERYYQSIRHKNYGFNISEYIHQVNLIQGVGAVRCYPATPGPGEVTLYILDSEYLPASQELIEGVQEILDPVPYSQLGMGRVPIGHMVHVKTPNALPVNIKIRLELAYGKDLDSYKAKINQIIEDHLASLRETFQNSYDPVDKGINLMVVRESLLEAGILSLNNDEPGSVVDVEVTDINGQDGNLTITGDSVPVLGEVVYGT